MPSRKAVRVTRRKRNCYRVYSVLSIGIAQVGISPHKKPLNWGFLLLYAWTLQRGSSLGAQCLAVYEYDTRYSLINTSAGHKFQWRMYCRIVVAHKNNQPVKPRQKIVGSWKWILYRKRTTLNREDLLITFALTINLVGFFVFVVSQSSLWANQRKLDIAPVHHKPIQAAICGYFFGIAGMRPILNHNQPWAGFFTTGLSPCMLN